MEALMSISLTSLQDHANKIANLLRSHNQQLVLAESCTGGLVSAVLAGLPGISENFCGSAVVYQVETKHSWLEISDNVLWDPGPVSELVARQMAQQVLLKTPRATLAASVTGHLGPKAPANLDGLVYTATAKRSTTQPTHQDSNYEMHVRKHQLQAEQLQQAAPAERIARQREAASIVLQEIETVLIN